MITRSQVAGALKMLNANNTPNRRGHLQNMLAAEHNAKDVQKALRDIESYPEWSARADLDVSGATAVADEAAIPVKKKKK